jgi:hypothetical protein
MYMKIFKQILKEFWLPFLVALGWMIYNIRITNPSDWTLRSGVNIFGPTFFLASWMTSQFFRVKKQVKLEDSFGNVERRVGQVIDELEQRTQNLLAHITGGESFPSIDIGSIDHASDVGVLLIVHHGSHPLYDVHARMVDLQKFESVKTNLSIGTLQLTETNLPIGNLIPSHCRNIGAWKLEHSPEQSYNIFFTARNGSCTQLLRMKK